MVFSVICVSVFNSLGEELMKFSWSSIFVVVATTPFESLSPYGRWTGSSSVCDHCLLAAKGFEIILYQQTFGTPQ